MIEYDPATVQTRARQPLLCLGDEKVCTCSRIKSNRLPSNFCSRGRGRGEAPHEATLCQSSLWF